MKEEKCFRVCYVAPKVELFKLGANLSYLTVSFSNEGAIGDLEDGEEFGEGLTV